MSMARVVILAVVLEGPLDSPRHRHTPSSPIVLSSFAVFACRVPVGLSDDIPRPGRGLWLQDAGRVYGTCESRGRSGASPVYRVVIILAFLSGSHPKRGDVRQRGANLAF